ncbi:hypothetical protein ACWD7F_35305 [Streptomyces sp. NPDC005122]
MIITGRKATRNHHLTDAEKEANHLLNRERAAVEHGFPNPKSWRFLTKIRARRLAAHSNSNRSPAPTCRTMGSDAAGQLLCDSTAADGGAY